MLPHCNGYVSDISLIFVLTVIGHSVLHPCLKLEYFRIQEWEQEWIDAAENLT
jgi:hypothetical protein